MLELRAKLPWADVTSDRLVLDQWSDLTEHPVFPLAHDIVSRYFDAGLHFRQNGSRTLWLRIPAALASQITPFADGFGVTSTIIDDSLVLELHRQEEDGEGTYLYYDPQPWLEELLPLQSDLATGDVRAPAIAWRAANENLSFTTASKRPPMPDGLDEDDLNPQLHALIRLLEEVPWTLTLDSLDDSAGDVRPRLADRPRVAPVQETSGPMSRHPGRRCRRYSPARPCPGPACGGRRRGPGCPGASGSFCPRPATSRRLATPRAVKPAADSRFPHGPLAVLDGDGSACCVDGLVLDCPATTVVALVERTLRVSGLGAARLHRHGKDSDPLIVLTAAAAVKSGLPERLEDRRGLRLAEDHSVVKQVLKAKWQLTQRGFGPWARVYRKA
ncbi:hypothetical protein ACFYZ1_03540 [Streptomyces chartreusis]|uniref:hypothetical protein n=1 Tax=Streptomyces chartreusis TaxID=1969 RepID=UPI0036CBC624